MVLSLKGVMERSHSGLVRSLGKRVRSQILREFESPSLRKKKTQKGFFFLWREARQLLVLRGRFERLFVIRLRSDRKVPAYVIGEKCTHGPSLRLHHAEASPAREAEAGFARHNFSYGEITFVFRFF